MFIYVRLNNNACANVVVLPTTQKAHVEDNECQAGGERGNKRMLHQLTAHKNSENRNLSSILLVPFTRPNQAHTRNNTPQQVVSASESVAQKRRQLAREATNRHVLAASTIRAWVARTCLSRRLRRRKRVRDDLKLRWEPEIQRIAATRIQAVARGAVGRRAHGRAERAAVDIQRVQRGWRGRLAVNELARTRYARQITPKFVHRNWVSIFLVFPVQPKICSDHI